MLGITGTSGTRYVVHFGKSANLLLTADRD